MFLGFPTERGVPFAGCGHKWYLASGRPCSEEPPGRGLASEVGGTLGPVGDVALGPPCLPARGGERSFPYQKSLPDPFLETLAQETGPAGDSDQLWLLGTKLRLGTGTFTFVSFYFPHSGSAVT